MKGIHTCQWLLLCLLSACLILSQTARAQEATAAITGLVTDQSGAPVAGAAVIARDLDRNVSYPSQTNAEGVFNLPRVPIGNYEVRAEAKGFQTAVNSSVHLSLDQTARVDFQMTVGSVTQVIEVTGAAELLQTETTHIGSTIDSHTSVALPLASRNYNQLTLLAPGATTTSPTAFTTGQSTFNSGRPYINGNREQANNYILDGMDNNEIANNSVAYAPSVDSIQEFNIITQNASAEFGSFMGGIINTSIKSGTDTYHASAFEFLRNDFFNANDWSRNFTGASTPLLRWNMFGGTAGGPIKKDKLFFFADYQGSRFDTPATPGAITVMTASARQGNFGYLCTAGFDASGICQGTGSGNLQLHDPRTGQPYAFNQIPTGQIDPIAKSIVNSSAYPMPINNNLVNNQYNTQHTATNGDQGDIKIDYNPTDKDRIFGRYSQQSVRVPTTNTLALLGDNTSQFPLEQGVIDYTRTFGSSLVNEARAGVSYFPISLNDVTGGAGNFSIPGNPTNQLSGLAFPANSYLGGSTGAPAFGNLDLNQMWNETTIQAEDTLILTKGRHTMHAGFQAFRYRNDYLYPSNDGIAGVFSFNGQYTGSAEADFMEGLPNFVGIGSNGGGQVGARNSRFGTFFQDDWRVTGKLTLNLGLRWELVTPITEVDNREINFNEITGQILIPGQNGASNALYNQYNGIANFQPRVGVAWTPANNTVIRAAFTTSSFMEANGVNNRLTQNPPFNIDRQATYTVSGAVPGLPGSTLSEGFAAATSPCNLSNVTSAPAGCFQGVTIHIYDPDFRPAVSNQWNFTIQRQFGKATTVQLGYLGQKTNHLSEISLLDQEDLVDGVVLPSPYLSGNPQLKDEIAHARATRSDAVQDYNALQAVFQRRLANGLQFQFNYVYSKCLSDAPGFFGRWGDSTATLASNGQAFPQNTYDLMADYGPCVYDVKHNFTGYLTYDLPFGAGRPFGKNANPVAKAVLGNWQFSSVLTFHTGFPFSIASVDASGTGSGFARANCVAPAKYLETPSPQGGYQWWDPSSFVAPTSGFGTCGLGTVNGPGYRDVDMSLTKQFNLTERQNVELRMEALNALNSPVIGPQGYSTDATGPQQGRFATSPIYSGRQLQFALKYSF